MISNRRVEEMFARAIVALVLSMMFLIGTKIVGCLGG